MVNASRSWVKDWFVNVKGHLFVPPDTGAAGPTDALLKVEVVKQDVGGFRIVGAGVSTCAPLTSGPR